MKNMTIHELFEKQVKKTPNEIALKYKENSLTYSELNQKANQLARVLRLKQVKAGVVVGIMLERSFEMIIGILAVLKAGGAYLPIDCKYPKSRIEYMLNDSDTKIVLSKTRQKSLISSCDIDFIDVEDLKNYDKKTENLLNINIPSDLIYIIYTSGSTGKPKGVMLEHKSVVNYIDFAKERYLEDCLGDFPLFTSVSFDLTVTSIYTPLLSGRSITIYDEADELPLEEIVSSNSDVVKMTPAHLSILSELDISKIDVKKFIIGGEDLKYDLAKKITEKFNSDIKIYNEYGPTEATVGCIVYEYCIDKQDGISVPIGKPINNTKVYILDKEKNLAQIGEEGELYISGAGLARGYLNRPNLTKEKFVDNPFNLKEKMYKTGDRAKWRDDGNIEFLGRVDDQVKIRGYRIELGEIENKLIKYKDIKKAVVLTKEVAGDKVLSAYVIANKDVEYKFIREFLLEDLPDYMVPGCVTRVEKFPLTTNGKIDKQALIQMEINEYRSVEYIMPENETQRKLEEIWGTVFSSNNISIVSNFFEMGGHSLKAMIVASRISKEFKVSISSIDVFSYPTIKALAEYIDGLKEEKYTSLRNIEEKEYYELSSAQQRMFVLSSIGDNSTNYNTTTMYKIDGMLDKDRLKVAIKQLISRHDCLRTSFHIINDEPRQKVNCSVDFKLEYLELNEMSCIKTKERIDNEIDNFIKPFDLSKAPLFRVKLIKLSSDSCVLITDIHHIISDGVTQEILVNDLTKLYKNEKLPQQCFQYKDYVAWQKEQVNTSEYKDQGKYWTNLLEGEIPLLNMPTDFQRPNIQKFYGESISFGIGKETKNRLRKVAKENNVTLYMILLAAYNVLLYKYSGQEDILVGSPVAGRTHADLENIVGVFVNTLVMRNNPNAGLKFKELLLQVKENALDAYRNQDYQFDDLVLKLNIKRDNSRNPLFDTLFVMQNNDLEKLHKTELDIDQKTIKKGSSKFDISLEATELEDCIVFNFNYCTELYRRQTIDRMSKHFIKILNVISKDSEMRLSDIDILTKEEEQMLYEFNDTTKSYPKNKTVHELFEEQVKKTPNELAVVYEEQQLTYRELNEKANRVARRLINKGVKVEDVVAIALQRSVEMIIGILAVLKAGAAYMPIDLKTPNTRIKYMLEDSNSKIVLTQKYSAISKEIFKNINVVNIDDEETKVQESSNLNVLVDAENLVYVIYTSGTTGKPKGVMIRNYNLVNLIYGLNEAILERYDRKLNIALVAPYIFDASVKQIFPALTLGHTLFIVPEEIRLSGEELAKYYVDHGIEVSDGTPTHLKMMSSSQKEIKDSQLCEMLIGGESLSPKVLANFFNMFVSNKPRVTNVYGPTECCDVSTIYSVVYDELDSQNNIPIGKPLANVKINVVDKNLNIQPLGVPGELCILGEGVSRGYLNKLELTVKKFVQDPLSGKTMYRTGDLVRWLDNGNIEFLGRIDTQVKVRGFRIELGEIENQLIKYPDIKEAIVLAKEDTNENKYLCGYVVAKKELTVSDIKEHLAKELPNYMIPSFFVQIDEIPLTPNGKVDKAELKRLKVEMNTGIEFEEPTNDIQFSLVNIFKQVLAINSVGINDSFFDLGGHSLKATTLISKIHKEFNVQIPMQEIFNTPTIKGISKYIEKSSKNYYSLINQVDSQEYYPLSSAQKRMYAINQLNKDDINYNMPSAYIVEGNLDILRLKEAYKDLMYRHESLRTSFEINDGVPVQIINEEVDFNIEYQELDNVLSDEDDYIKRVVNKFVRPFDLSKAPLIRVKIVRLKNKKYVLITDMHHIVSDGVSVGIVNKELSKLYNDEQLANQRVQYKDYSSWQKQQSTTQSFKDKEKYWLEVFGGELPILNLPTDYNRPSIKSFEGKSIDFTIDCDTRNRLLEISKENNITLFMLLLAAYNVLLFKYTGQEDIVVGSPIAGRQHEDLENVVGVFINTLAMRNYPQNDKSFVELLKEVKKNSLKAYANQEYQFEELVEKLRINRDSSRNPIFDTMFVLQNIDPNSMKFNGLKVEEMKISTDSSKFDMTLRAFETRDELRFNLEYNISLFKLETIIRMKEHFINILKAITQKPQIKIKDIDSIPNEEKNQILHSFNKTNIEHSESNVFHELFEKQAEKTPNNIAVVFENENITYKELNEKSNQLARLLRKRGINRNEIVGIVANPSIEMIIGILSVLKAGGAYLPIDPKFPEDRIKYMINDSNCRLILTQSDLVEFVSCLGIESIDIEDECIVKENPYNLNNVNESDDLIYIIYTSGTTGKPKGVLLSNESLSNYVKWFITEVNLKSSDRGLLISSFAFDLGYTTIFPTLIAGSELHLMSKENYLNIEMLADYMLAEDISFLKITPTFYSALVSNDKFFDNMGRNLRLVVLGGEQIRAIDVEETYKKHKSIQIMNHYGPTESTIGVIAQIIDREKIDDFIQSPTLGKPINNTRIYIMDSNDKIQPIGVIGQICIAGKGLSKGYLNRAILTSEKFADNPYENNERMYKTGDLGRWKSDGSIEFLGRVDDQVKVRGYRIELSEIKAVLERFDSIKSAVVIVRKDENIGDQLVAYIVAYDDLPINRNELKKHIKLKLPPYMVPTKFIVVDEIPLTANGKTDKKALMSMQGEQISLSTNNDIATNWIQELLISIWSDILKTNKIGIDDDFFELGGHSLLATQLISKIRSSFKVDINIGDIFKYTTISLLSELVGEEIRKGQNKDVEKIKKAKHSNVLSLSSAQQRLWFYDQLEPNSPIYNVPKIMRMSGKLVLEALEDSFNKIISRHDIFRTTFKEIDGEAVQIVNLDKGLRLNVVDLRSYPTEQVEDVAFEICKEKVKEVFDLTKGPLLKVSLLRLRENDNILVINMHHIVCDGWSVGIMLNEIQTYYTAYIKGIKECLLPKLPIQYGDFAIWQHQWLKGEVFTEGIDYWQRKLSGELPVLEISKISKNSQTNNYIGAICEFNISKELSVELKELSRNNSSTLFMTLLAAFTTLLYRYTDQTDILIGTPIANRNRCEIEKLIGFFVNTLVLRTDLSGNPTFEELLLRVREVALEAYMHQDIPFEKIVEKLSPERHADVSPLFQVMFSLQNTPKKVIELPELTLRPIRVHTESAKFDLDLTIEERESGLHASFEYNTDLFDDEAIKSMSEDYQIILESIVENSKQRISSITMRSDIVDLDSSDLDEIFA